MVYISTCYEDAQGACINYPGFTSSPGQLYFQEEIPAGYPFSTPGWRDVCTHRVGLNPWPTDFKSRAQTTTPQCSHEGKLESPFCSDILTVIHKFLIYEHFQIVTNNSHKFVQ